MPNNHDSKTATADLFDRAARQLLAQEQQAMVSHPGVDELVALQEGRLPADRAEALRAHLALCPECADDFLDLEVFDSETANPSADDASDRPDSYGPDSYGPDSYSPEDEEASWQRFRRQLSERQPAITTPPTARGGAAPATAAASGPRRPASPGRGRAPRWMLAASVLFALTGLWGWWSSLAPQGNGPAVALSSPFDFTLRPDGATTIRSGTAIRTLEVPATADALVPTLLLGETTPHSRYRAEVHGADQQVVFARDDLPRFDDGRFVLLVPRTRLPDGRYTLHLFGQRDGEDYLLATYSFLLRDVRGEMR